MNGLMPSRRRRLIQLFAVLGTVVLLLVLWQPLVAWFTGKPMGGGASGEAVATQAGDVQLKLALQPDPPKQAGNTLLIEAKDASGAPLKDADVSVTYSMPAMGAMPEMKGEAKVEEAGEGRYRATFDLPMGGTWTLTTQVKAPKAEATARHTLTVGTSGLTAVSGSGMAGMGGSAGAEAGTGGAGQKPLAPAQLPDSSLEHVRAAFGAYEGIRALLARDTVEGIAPRAEEMAAALRAAAEAAQGGPADVAQCLQQGVETAQKLGAATSLEEARQRFSEVSQYLVALADADKRLQEGWHVFSCPMVKDGFNKWFQRSPRLENPYMGRKMLACGSPVDWSVAIPTSATAQAAAGAGHAGHVEGGSDVSHYTCAMHPSVKQQGPGACPICGMDLTPVTKAEVQEGVIMVDEGRRQRIGVKTAPVTVAPMDTSVRALGRVTYDEKALEDITLRLDGYIHDLKVNATGEPVKKGDVLFTLYSPELYAAQQEYILARNSQSEANASLVRASKKRLQLWGLTEGQIARVARKGEPIENMPFLSPVSGYVLEKNVVTGAAVKAGERLFRIAPLDRVWVEAEVYEQDLPHVKEGQQVTVTLPNLPGREYQGTVAYVYPALEGQTRTGKVRVELPNPNLELKPDMYANVHLGVQGGERLQVPESAVIYTGPRTLVFVDLGEGRLKPQEVKLGLQGDEGFEVLEGLQPGDRVVTSGNFLIAAESRIRSAADYWSGGEQ
jgi:Cu(I)/Ag(I) efflux system membrane fusion protein